ncbi:MAG: integrase zinc binding domain-containing protein, partial [Plesiomonas shigelloides]
MIECKHSESLSTVPGAEIDLSLAIDRVTLANVQKHDNSLARCRAAVVKKEDVFIKPVAYFWDDGLLMRKRTAVISECEVDAVYQIVVPTQFRSHVLMLAHDHSLSGHLGITKTYHRI